MNFRISAWTLPFEECWAKGWQNENGMSPHDIFLSGGTCWQLGISEWDGLHASGVECSTPFSGAERKLTLTAAMHRTWSCNAKA